MFKIQKKSLHSLHALLRIHRCILLSILIPSLLKADQSKKHTTLGCYVKKTKMRWLMEVNFIKSGWSVLLNELINVIHGSPKSS
jgi:hypothetical protein